jgi:hypothetical protein
VTARTHRRSMAPSPGSGCPESLRDLPTTEKQMAEHVPMPGDHPVAPADDPHEWRIPEHGAELSPADDLQDVETGPSAAQHSPVRRNDVHGEPAALRQLVRHRRARRLFVRHRVQEILLILSLGPSDRPATERSASVPEHPRLVGPMRACLARCRHRPTAHRGQSTSRFVRSMTIRGHTHVKLYRVVGSRRSFSGGYRATADRCSRGTVTLRDWWRSLVQCLDGNASWPAKLGPN